MDIVAEHTFVIDGCTSIDNTVPADFYVRLDYCALHDGGDGGYGCIFRNNSGRMDRGDGHLFAIILQILISVMNPKNLKCIIVIFH